MDTVLSKFKSKIYKWTLRSELWVNTFVTGHQDELDTLLDWGREQKKIDLKMNDFGFDEIDLYLIVGRLTHKQFSIVKKNRLQMSPNASVVLLQNKEKNFLSELYNLVENLDDQLSADDIIDLESGPEIFWHRLQSLFENKELTI